LDNSINIILNVNLSLIIFNFKPNNLQLRMAVKTRIGEVLHAEGRTNVWLSQKMNKTQNTISLWVNGKVSITLDDLYKVSDALGVPVKELLHDNLIDAPKKTNSNQSKPDNIVL
jgi:transcriptional regulator with XRE-family HTH domain